MKRITKALVVAAALVAPVLVAPVMATAQVSAASCIPQGSGQLIYSAAYYECLGHSPRAAAQFAALHAAQTGAAS
ncbi:MAG: hypothetical protein V2I65_07055 [Paracoccaceae bacterium]|jgi:hypothetical protein|nr:hypothetical protein [Paracoccaceae bacterium]